MRTRFSTAQILGFLREAAAGTPIMEVCWNHCFSRSTFRAWRRSTAQRSTPKPIG